MTSAGAPLAGVTIVAMEQAVAAPMCTRVLADFGARVIKVENPNGGDFARDYDDVVNGPGGLAAHFVWCNRGKESVTLNTKSPEGMDLLHRLLDRADAFVSNLAPVPPPGWASRPPTSQCATPMSSRSRSTDMAPVARSRTNARMTFWCRRSRVRVLSPAIPVCPQSRAPRWPISPRAIRRDIDPRAAVRAQGRPDGVAAPSVELSLFDVMTDVMGYALTYTQHSGIDQQPLGVGSPAVAPYGAFPTRDGQTVVLGTTNDREWQRVAREIIDRPDLADDPRFATNSGRCAHRDILDEAIGAWCAQHDLAEIQKVADAAGIGNSATTCRAKWWCTRS